MSGDHNKYLSTEEYIRSLQPQYDVVSKPKHYELFPDKNIEVRDLMKVLADRLDYDYPAMLISDYIQLMQYLLRWDQKNGSEDLEKAGWYLQKVIEQVQGLETHG